MALKMKDEDKKKEQITAPAVTVPPTVEVKVNPEIDKKINEYMAANQKTVDYLRGLPQEQLVRKICLAELTRKEAYDKKTAEALEWINKPEQAQLKETFMLAIPAQMKPEQVQQRLKSMALTAQNQKKAQAQAQGMGV